VGGDVTSAALASGALWLGYRMVALVAGNLITVNLARYNHVRGEKRRVAVPTGCGCAVWMDREKQNAT